MVVDVGGTTSDVGMLVHGFPREASIAVDIGGVRTNFRMPDVVSFGLGGGSLVRQAGGGCASVRTQLGTNSRQKAVSLAARSSPLLTLPSRRERANSGIARTWRVSILGWSPPPLAGFTTRSTPRGAASAPARAPLPCCPL